MRIATWNINSVRLRLNLLLDILNKQNLDVICLQETKTPDSHFPINEIKDAGYDYVHFNGMKSYNGVAIVSRIPFSGEEIYSRVDRDDCRHISVKFPEFELHNLYIPAGGDEPDPEINDKFKHKLDFVDEICRFFENNYSKSSSLILTGDFNIAPLENDVWSHKQLLKIVSHTDVEVEKLNKMKNTLDWIDVSRYFVPEDEKCYSWWSYRNRNWRKSNRGRRLDHIWVTPNLKSNLSSHDILLDARDLEKPSDHVPVILELHL